MWFLHIICWVLVQFPHLPMTSTCWRMSSFSNLLYWLFCHCGLSEKICFWNDSHLLRYNHLKYYCQRYEVVYQGEWEKIAFNISCWNTVVLKVIWQYYFGTTKYLQCFSRRPSHVKLNFNVLSKSLRVSK